MNYKMIGRFLSQIIAIEAVFMLPAMEVFSPWLSLVIT